VFVSIFAKQSDKITKVLKLIFKTFPKLSYSIFSLVCHKYVCKYTYLSPFGLPLPLPHPTFSNKVLNDLWRTRLFLRWFDSAPRPPPLSPSESCLSFSVFLCVAGRAYWRGWRGGRGAKSNYREKAWSSIKHSLLSALNQEDSSRSTWGLVVFVLYRITSCKFL
jgi:hypothetical protein